MFNTTMFNTIILIDDDVAVNYYNKYIIESIDAAKEVFVADDVDKAASLLSDISKKESEQLGPGLILLDINMPKYTGFEFLEKYKTLFNTMENKGFVVYILSTSENPAEIDKAMVDDNSIMGYLSKPLTVPTLTNLIEKNCVPA